MNVMKSILLVCGVALAVTVFNLPIGYLLGIVVTIGSVAVLAQESNVRYSFLI